MVLANASLDIAFHDTYLLKKIRVCSLIGGLIFLSNLPIFFTDPLPCIDSMAPKGQGSKKKNRGSSKEKLFKDTMVNVKLSSIVTLDMFIKEKNEIDLKNYVEQFFVGLLEGDGTITVDYISDRKKRIRMFIALKNLEENRFMLNLIIKYIGGAVAIQRKDAYVT